MKVDFNTLPEDARIWVYQSDKALDAEAEAKVKATLDDFVTQWDSHGAPVKAGYEIRYKHFIVIGADNSFNAPSGCSIDKSVALMKTLEAEHSVSLFNRTNVAFVGEDGSLFTTPMNDIAKLASSHTVSPDSITFNNMVENKADFDTKWKVAAKDSWVARYFK